MDDVVRTQKNPAFAVADDGIKLPQKISAEDDIESPGAPANRDKVGREQLAVFDHGVAELQAADAGHGCLLFSGHAADFLIVGPDLQAGFLR